MNTAEKRATIASLRARLRRDCHDSETVEGVTELGPLARMLSPAWRSGGTAEICGAESAALTLAVWLAARRAGPTVLIDPSGEVYPHALTALGLDAQRMVTIRPPEGRLALWAAEQSLRCSAVAATLCRLGPRLTTTAARRLKLAAEVGGGLGLVVRQSAREPPFSDVRLVVRPLRSESTETLRPRWDVEAVYIRGGMEGLRCTVEVTSDARLVSVPSPVVRAAGPRRRVGG